MCFTSSVNFYSYLHLLIFFKHIPICIHTRTQQKAPKHISDYNMFRDQLYAPKCICVLSQAPLYRAFRHILATLYDMAAHTDLLGLGLESHLHNLVYELPMPQPGRLLKFSVGCLPALVHMPDCYRADSPELPLCDLDMFDFFSLFAIPDIVSFYIAALLEHQILLYRHVFFLAGLCLSHMFFSRNVTYKKHKKRKMFSQHRNRDIHYYFYKLVVQHTR